MTGHSFLTPAFIRAANRYLLISTELRRADLGLVFGGRRSAAARAQRAVELWRRGLFDRILIAGGKADDANVSEAEAIAPMLFEQGVPKSAALLETRSTNTGENVRFAIEELKRAGLHGQIRSIICIGRFSTSRRYLMTLERHWPKVTKMLSAANYHDVDPAQWHTHEALAEEVRGEWQRLRPYLKAGFIRELNLRTCPLVCSDRFGSGHGPHA